MRVSQWGGWGSNPRPRDYESPALTTELPPRKRTTGSHIGDPECLAPGVGLEPTTYGLTDRRCCQLSYPGSAICHVTASIIAMTRLNISELEYRTLGHPRMCFADRIDGSGTARYGFVN